MSYAGKHFNMYCKILLKRFHMNGQIIELRPQTLKLGRYWSFCRGLGLGKLKGSCCAVLPLWPVPQKKKPLFPNTHLIRTRHYYEVALSVGKESPYIFFKFNPLDTDTPLLWTIFMAPSVSVLTGFDCIWKRLVSYENTTEGASYQGGGGGGGWTPKKFLKCNTQKRCFQRFPGSFPGTSEVHSNCCFKGKF